MAVNNIRDLNMAHRLYYGDPPDFGPKKIAEHQGYSVTVDHVGPTLKLSTKWHGFVLSVPKQSEGETQ
jgi:hypothetical protein